MEKTKKKKIQIISTVIGIILLVGIGISIAYLLSRATGSSRTVSVGNLSITYTNESVLRLTGNTPIYDDEIATKAPKISFRITNNGNITAYAQVQLTNISMSSALKSQDFKYALYESSTNTLVQEGNFVNASTTLTIKEDISLTSGSYKDYVLYAWLSETGENQIAMANTTFSGKVTINATARPNN